MVIGGSIVSIAILPTSSIGAETQKRKIYFGEDITEGKGSGFIV